jgi:hypothetical protein
MGAVGLEKTHDLNTSVRASNLTFTAVHKDYHHISLIVRDTVSAQLMISVKYT